jgi:hypothetical protein
MALTSKATGSRDIPGGVLYLSAALCLLSAEWFGYSQYVLSFFVPGLVLCIFHWVAVRIYLRQ